VFRWLSGVAVAPGRAVAANVGDAVGSSVGSSVGTLVVVGVASTGSPVTVTVPVIVEWTPQTNSYTPARVNLND